MRSLKKMVFEKMLSRFTHLRKALCTEGSRGWGMCASVPLSFHAAITVWRAVAAAEQAVASYG